MNSDSRSGMENDVLVSQGPLGALYACHRRILGQCGSLGQLALHIAECGQSLEVQMVSRALLRFFDNDVPQHYADEEQGLFPVLIDSMAGSDAVCLRELTRGSIEQHQVLGIEWGKLRMSIEHVAAGHTIILPARDLDAFAERWSANIEMEESELLPMAARLLSDDELARMDLSIFGCRRCPDA